MEGVSRYIWHDNYEIREGEHIEKTLKYAPEMIIQELKIISACEDNIYDGTPGGVNTNKRFYLQDLNTL